MEETIMRIIALAASFAASMLVPASIATAQYARQELLPVHSLTMSDPDFLQGKKDGKSVVLAGTLKLPKSGPDKMPAVIILHGSGGLGGSSATHAGWENVLNAMGLATFMLDSFSGRGVINTVTDQSQVGRFNMMFDAFRALEVLAMHRLIDAKRIAVMGFSRGGQPSLYSSMDRFYQMHGSPDVRFAAHIAVYASCGAKLRDDENVGRPILVLHGTADDWVPMAPCKEYAERLAKNGKDVRFIEYADAHHSFDNAIYKAPLKLPQAQHWRSCKMAEENGVIINVDTRQPFTFSDACVQRGTSIVYNEAATLKARADVKEFLTRVLELK